VCRWEVEWSVQVTVVLKHMFHPDELMAEPSMKDDLEADITSECTKLGPIDKARGSPLSLNGLKALRC
jgi:hypothetical protein